MIKIEIKEKEYEVPSGWHEVNLELYEKIMVQLTILKDYKSEIEYTLDMFSVISGAPKEDLRELTRAGFMKMVEVCNWANEPIKATGKKIFVIDGVEWMAIKDMNKLSMGDTISLELIIKDSNEINIVTNIMPILIRPVKKIKGLNGKFEKIPGEFEAERYNEIKELFKKNLYIANIYDLKGFFLTTEV